LRQEKTFGEAIFGDIAYSLPYRGFHALDPDFLGVVRSAPDLVGGTKAAEREGSALYEDEPFRPSFLRSLRPRALLRRGMVQVYPGLQKVAIFYKYRRRPF